MTIQETKQKVVELKNNGHSFAEIGEELEISKTSAYNYYRTSSKGRSINDVPNVSERSINDVPNVPKRSKNDVPNVPKRSTNDVQNVPNVATASPETMKIYRQLRLEEMEHEKWLIINDIEKLKNENEILKELAKRKIDIIDDDDDDDDYFRLTKKELNKIARYLNAFKNEMDTDILFNSIGDLLDDMINEHDGEAYPVTNHEDFILANKIYDLMENDKSLKFNDLDSETQKEINEFLALHK